MAQLEHLERPARPAAIARLEAPAPALGAARVLALASAVLLLAAVTRYGWVSDDAFIAVRAAVHFVGGRGLVSNVGERVDAFTSPLWTLIVAGAYALVRSPYWAALGAGLACSAALAWVVARRRDAGFAPATALVLLAASSGFASFSTSGLENPLSHLLLAAFVLDRFRPADPRRLPFRSAIAGLVLLNRLDHGLLVLPALLVDARRAGARRGARLVAIAAALPVAWMCFSTFYYGFPLPNTAYAKLDVAVGRAAMLQQGVAYLADAFLEDPIVPIVIGACALLLVSTKRRPAASVAAAVGVLVYLVYVVAIGGDFMSGRFLTAPYLVAVLVLAEVLREAPPLCSGAVALVALIAAGPLAPMPPDQRTRCAPPPSGIVDERACYVEHTGIAQNFRKEKYEQHPYYKDGVHARGKRVVVDTRIGLFGLAAGPGVQIIDPYGLSDPLLARIRFHGDDWRIGHFRRALPKRYVESVEQDRNLLAPGCVHDLYDDLRVITRGKLLGRKRFAAIWRANVIRPWCPP